MSLSEGKERGKRSFSLIIWKGAKVVVVDIDVDAPWQTGCGMLRRDVLLLFFIGGIRVEKAKGEVEG